MKLLIDAKLKLVETCFLRYFKERYTTLTRIADGGRGGDFIVYSPRLKQNYINYFF